MKFNIYTIVLMGILGTSPLCYAQTSGDKASMKEVKQETQDLIQTLDSYTVKQKNEAIRKTKKALDKVDKRIESLEARVDKSWDKMSEEARKNTRDSLKALRKQRNQVAEWFGSMKNTTGNAWGHMKKGFSDAYKTLNNAWQKSENEFESSK